MKLYLTGLSEAGGRRVQAQRGERPYASVQELTERAALNRRDLEALAANALVSLAGHRHLAFWNVAGTEKALPLASAVDDSEVIPLVHVPTEAQTTHADYASTRLTLNRHPMAFLRSTLKERGFLTAKNLHEVRDGVDGKARASPSAFGSYTSTSRGRKLLLLLLMRGRRGWKGVTIKMILPLL